MELRRSLIHFQLVFQVDKVVFRFHIQLMFKIAEKVAKICELEL